MKKILVVEDEEHLFRVLSLALEEEGYKVLFSESGKTGLEMVRSATPDLILLDVLLPDLDGFDVCAALKTNPEFQSIPVIMMTALGDTENTLKGFSVGADDYVSKPFHLRELLGRVKAHLRMKELYDIVKTEEEEKTALLGISQALSSTSTPHETLYLIVSKIAEVIKTQRCSIIHIGPQTQEGFVMASHDSREIRRLKINLEKYPEILKVRETGEPVVINDVAKAPLLSPVWERIGLTRIKSILAFPIFFQEDLIGTLILRTCRRERVFTEREIKFCGLITHLAAAPLKNAYRMETLHLEKDLERNRRQASEEALTEKTLHLENILRSSIKMAIAATDMDFRIIYYNPTAEAIFGYTAEEVIGRTVMDIHTREKVDHARFERAIEIVKKEGEYIYYVMQEKADGTRHIESRVTGIWDKKGKLVGFVLMSMDITERKKTEEVQTRLLSELKDAKTELEKSNAELLVKVNELERFQRVTMGREERIIELKKKLKEIEGKKAEG